MGMALFIAGCASMGGQGANRESSDMLGGSRAAAELASAQRLIQSGDYSMAISRLQGIVGQYSNSPAGIESRYFLGFAYQEIGSYGDAVKNFSEYLTLAPMGSHAEDARQCLAKLDKEQASTALSAEDASKRIDELKAKIVGQPDQATYRLELATLLWQSGRYEEVGAVYQEILKRWPNMSEDATVRARIEQNADGTVVVLTPQQVVQRNAENDPLLLFNVTSFRSGRTSGGWSTELKHNIYNVSGNAKNRGTKVLNNVQISVTIYGFTGMIYDTQTINLGQMRPGQARAFSARFSNFDDIENVHHYECVGSYE